MGVQENLCCVVIIILLFSRALSDTLSDGVFHFESSNIVNGDLFAIESARVNITFTVQSKNHTKVNHGDIEIAHIDTLTKVFNTQCKIRDTCKSPPSYNNVSCQCLDTPGFYFMTFIADRKLNGQWKWIAKQNVEDVILTFNITYPASIIALQIVSYNAPIARYKTVTVFCTWENGNPPTRVLLLDRHNNVLAERDTSGNVSYTFSHVDCRHAGVIRCEAYGSNKNMSANMLIECEEFNFETSEITNGTYLVKEGTSVNITFTIQRNNSSEIDISKSDGSLKIFTPQCKILPNCQYRQTYNKVSCQCLDTSGFYSITFIADRKDNALWTWSSKPGVRDANIFFNVTYPASIIALQIVSYNAPIARYKTVTVLCTWENGNPPTRVLLLDRHNNVLAERDTSGNVSYTFSSVDCRNAGVIRCEAYGSNKNMSANMLIECPPEFERTSTIQNLNIGPNDDVTFPFRSHTAYISSCHITNMKQNTDGDINQSLTDSFKCTKLESNETDVITESKHCMYYVTGEPPDLNLTIHVRNLTRKDGGLWYVNISNNEGSGALYVQVNINEGIPESKETSPKINNLRAVIEQQAVMIERLQNKVDALENRVSMSQRQLDYASKKVAFSARFSRDDENNGIPLTSRQILKFDDVVTNIGGGYSSQTGIFTAPVTGVYAFFLNFMTTVKRRDVLLAIDQQGTTLDLVYAQGTDDPHDQGSALVTTYMVAGQQLWVRQHVGDAVRGSWYTIFSGFLIDED